MNSEAVVAIIWGLSAFSKKSIGLKKIPPPIPTIPDTKPRTEPIVKETKKFNFLIMIFSSSYDLLFVNNSIPTVAKTKNNIIMGIADKKNNILGLQFHPESIGTKNGKKILSNFLKIIDYDLQRN